MVVKIIDLLSNNMVRANGNDWYELYKKVKKLREETPADEVITLDFERVDARFEAETIYASNIVALPNVNIVLYNNTDVWAALRVVALLNGKSEDCIKNVEVEIKTLTYAPPSEKELRNRRETEHFRKIIKDIFVFGGVMRVYVEKMVTSDITNIRSNDRGISFRNALREVVDEHLANGKPLDRVVVDTRGVDVGPHVKSALADEAGDYSVKGIKLILISDDAEEQRKLNLRTDIGKRVLPANDKFKLLKRLGGGTVGLLTKFKKRKSDNIDLRLDDEITNQYIAILRGADMRTGVAKFTCFKYSELTAKWDEYDASGEALEPPTMIKKEININELGLERACIGSTWHFNRFDGAAEGEKTRKTKTRVDGAMMEIGSPAEEVLIPEYIRRALLSYDIKFNNQGLVDDVAKFRMDMEAAEKEKGRG